jgi:hypothetical protein
LVFRAPDVGQFGGKGGNEKKVSEGLVLGAGWLGVSSAGLNEGLISSSSWRSGVCRSGSSATRFRLGFQRLSDVPGRSSERLKQEESELKKLEGEEREFGKSIETPDTPIEGAFFFLGMHG